MKTNRARLRAYLIFPGSLIFLFRSRVVGTGQTRGNWFTRGEHAPDKRHLFYGALLRAVPQLYSTPAVYARVSRRKPALSG